MVRTGSAILILFIISKEKEILPRVNLRPGMASCFHLYFKVLGRYY